MNLKRAITITLARIKRGPVHVIAAILVMAAAFFVVTVFTFIFVQSKLALSYLESVPQVTAFLKDTATQDDSNALIGEVQSSGLAATIKYVSPAEALNTYKQLNSSDPELTALVDQSYFPPSIEVQAKELKNLGKIADIFNAHKDKTVDRVIYFSDVVQNLTKFTEGVKNTALILLGLLLLSLTITSIFITGLQTYVNRDEVEIMRLIGATKAFVYTPFILEAVFYGIVSSLIASAAAMATIPYILGWYSDLFKGISSVQVSYQYYAAIIGASLVIGLVTNLIGSYIAVRRYAKV